MAYELEKFSSGTMDKGIQAVTMDFSADVQLAIASYNMTQGIQQGLGPRFGMSPIPGQCGTDAPAANEVYNLQKSEGTGTAATGMRNRINIYGIFPLSLPDPDDSTKRIISYAYLVATNANEGSNRYYFDIVMSSTRILGPDAIAFIEKLSSDIRKGLSAASGENENFNNTPLFVEGIFPVSRLRQIPFFNYAYLASGISSTPKYISSTLGLAGGGNIPMQWIWGQATAVGDATHAPNVSYRCCIIDDFSSAGSALVNGGVPSEYNQQNYTTAQRFLKVYGLQSDSSGNTAYTVAVNPSSTFFIENKLGRLVVTNLDVSTLTAIKDSGPVATYAATTNAIVNDENCVVNSSYKAILAAPGKALACLFQDGYQNEAGKYNQWIDLTQTTFSPISCNSDYTENGVKVTTCFSKFPAFVRDTAMVNGSVWVLGAASTGILRANTTYEFTYSLYNKRLNYESNVGVPVKFRTGTNDFVSLRFVDTGLAAANDSYYSFSGLVDTGIPFSFFNRTVSATYGSYTGTFNYINFYEYRFYYRQEGTFEWLPALTMDAARFWFYPKLFNHVACTGSLAASTGGQPGGFNDYSPLPQDTWNDVKIYKNRAFWFSATQCQFSLYNNFFAYPGRNSLACPSGEFRGAILHNYPGQAEQNARLVIFGTKETYVGRFTGDKLQAGVQISPSATGVFDIDGSDFVVDAWTSVTAFSHRSAIVAEGILFWWGPQGVYRDDGVNTPTRISTGLEPNIFNLYDPAGVLDIHANYNDQSKEIEWFYKPKTADGDGDVQHALIYNVRSGNWTRKRYFQQLDWVQNLTVESDIDTGGLRQVIGTRSTAGLSDTQMAYFYDQKNRAGDMCEFTQLVVKQSSTPSTGVRRLTLAAGYNAGALQMISVGDYIALQQTNQYSGSTDATDMVATVNAISTTSGYIDIDLPTDGVLSDATLTVPTYFPIWHAAKAATGQAGLNGIPYRLETTYWVPNGVNAYYFWLYIYLYSKISLWASDLSLGPTLSYRCPTAVALIADSLAYANNSDGSWQIYHPLRPGNDNMEGQGIKIVLSGVQIGHEWVLQYMEAHGTPVPGDTLKRFEG